MRLLVFGHNDWWTWADQGFCGRNAGLVRALARRPEVERVAVVDTPRYRSRSRRPAARRGEAVSEVGPGIAAVRYDFRLPAPATWHMTRVANERLALPGLRRRIFAALPAGPPPLVWVADPRAADVALRFARDLLIFDAIDDWSYLPGVDRRGVERGYHLLAESAGLTLAVNASLLARLRPQGLATVLPNAIETGDWQRVLPDPDIFKGLPRPVVAYAGTLQERVDVGLLTAIARLAPEITLALIGPERSGFTIPSDAPRNLLVLPALPHARVPGVLLAADACMVPHRRTGIVETMDPLKIYEYLAAGRPVVSTMEPPYPPLRPFVRVAHDGSGFAAALREEIAADDDERRAERRAAVRDETWDARAARVLELVAAARAARRGGTP